MTDKYCVDCKYLGPVQQCVRVAEGTFSLVTGKKSSVVYGFDAEIERHTPNGILKYAKDDREIILCGREAKFFVPKG